LKVKSELLRFDSIRIAELPGLLRRERGFFIRVTGDFNNIDYGAAPQQKALCEDAYSMNSVT